MTKTGVNNLSQQLCELCGIKPRYFIEFTRTSGCGAIAKSLSTFSYRTIRSAKNYIIEHKNETESELRIVQRYPDFENPENFVKLFELKTLGDATLFSNVITYAVDRVVDKHVYYIFRDRQSFLKLLIEYLESDVYQERFIKSVKQAIASEEWEY